MCVPDLVLLLLPCLASVLPPHLLHLLLGEEHGDVDGLVALQGLELDGMLDEVGDGALPDLPVLVVVGTQHQLVPPLDIRHLIKPRSLLAVLRSREQDVFLGM